MENGRVSIVGSRAAILVILRHLLFERGLISSPEPLSASTDPGSPRQLLDGESRLELERPGTLEEEEPSDDHYRL
jgi:hypothetical protein